MRQGTILVVEDDDGLREAIESLLDAAGFVTASFASAEALLSAGCMSGAICVVSDIRLPAMSGLELVTKLNLRDGRLPVVLVTAHDSPSVRRDALRRGAAGYLAKPFAGGALLAAIEGVVKGTA